MTTDAPDTEAGPRRRLPWHVIYYLLAAFDVLTVSGSLYLGRRLFEVHTRAVADNQEWATHVSEYSGLERLAAEVNAPGNDVFDSHDVARESARLGAALVAFERRLEQQRWHLGETHSDEAASLLARIEEVARAMHDMAAEARVAFEEFAAGEPERAGRRMAAMDRRYARVLQALRELREDVGRVQQRLFAEQTATGRRLRRVGIGISGLVFLMVGAAIVYGSRIKREMAREVEARVRYIDGLREAEEGLRRAHAQLELRVEERTRALQESESALRLAASEWRRTFDAIESPVMILDLQGRLTRANAATRIHAAAGGESVALTSRIVTSLGEGEPWRTVAQLVARAREGGVPAAARVRDEASGRSWELASYLASPEGTEEGRLIVVARDTTRMVELQEALQRDERMAAMGALVAGVAHEVRNPIFAISSTLDAFEARFGGQAGLVRYFSVLRREVDRLGHLMKDLLDYASPPRLEAVPACLRQVVAEGVRACETEAARAQVTVANEVDDALPEAVVDPPRLAQVVQNVVHNAIVHTPAGGRVTVTARAATVHRRAGLECIVRDHGPGFSSVDLPRVFEPLFTRRAGGTGLGLAIAQRIVELHGGAMQAANADEGGAVVSFRIPLDGPGPPPDQEARG